MDANTGRIQKIEGDIETYETELNVLSNKTKLNEQNQKKYDELREDKKAKQEELKQLREERNKLLDRQERLEQQQNSGMYHAYISFLY